MTYTNKQQPTEYIKGMIKGIEEAIKYGELNGEKMDTAKFILKRKKEHLLAIEEENKKNEKEQKEKDKNKRI